MNDNRCTYCGFSFDIVREHVIPAEWLGNRSYDTNHVWIVPACKQCNAFAGASIHFSIPEKASYILKHYKQKTRRIMKTAHWSDDELEELDYKFRAVIEAALVEKRMVQNRLVYLESVTQMDAGYMRPDWVEQKLKELQIKYRNSRLKIRKREKNRIQKEDVGGSDTKEAEQITQAKENNQDTGPTQKRTR